MFSSIKPICDHGKMRKDGTSLIFLQCSFSRQKHPLLNTKIAIPPQFWISKISQVVESIPAPFGTASSLNKDVRRQVRLEFQLSKLTMLLMQFGNSEQVITHAQSNCAAVSGKRQHFYAVGD